VVHSCEQCNEPLGFNNGKEFLGQVSDYQFSRGTAP
jgi:hypothetical protein